MDGQRASSMGYHPWGYRIIAIHRTKVNSASRSKQYVGRQRRLYATHDEYEYRVRCVDADRELFEVREQMRMLYRMNRKIYHRPNPTRQNV